MNDLYNMSILNGFSEILVETKKKYLCILIISTKWPKIKYKKIHISRNYQRIFEIFFFVLFLKSRRTSTNKNLTHFVHLKISYGQATQGKKFNPCSEFVHVVNTANALNCGGDQPHQCAKSAKRSPCQQS